MTTMGQYTANLMGMSALGRAHLTQQQEAGQGRMLQDLQQVGLPLEGLLRHPHPLHQEACNRVGGATLQAPCHVDSSGEATQTAMFYTQSSMF